MASAQIRDETVVGTPQAAAATSQIRDEAVVQSPQTSSTPIRDEAVVQSPRVAATLTQIRDETIAQSPQSAPAASLPSSSNAINWTDAAIGAGGLLALLLLGAGSAYAVVHRRRSRPEHVRNLTV